MQRSLVLQYRPLMNQRSTGRAVFEAQDGMLTRPIRRCGPDRKSSQSVVIDIEVQCLLEFAVPGRIALELAQKSRGADHVRDRRQLPHAHRITPGLLEKPGIVFRHARHLRHVDRGDALVREKIGQPVIINPVLRLECHAIVAQVAFEKIGQDVFFDETARHALEVVGRQQKYCVHQHQSRHDPWQGFPQPAALQPEAGHISHCTHPRAVEQSKGHVALDGFRQFCRPAELDQFLHACRMIYPHPQTRQRQQAASHREHPAARSYAQSPVEQTVPPKRRNDPQGHLEYVQEFVGIAHPGKSRQHRD